MTGVLFHICELIGSEMIWPHLRGTSSRESAREAQIFMQRLEINDPKLLEECMEQLEVHQAFVEARDATKMKILEAVRTGFCQPRAEGYANLPCD